MAKRVPFVDEPAAISYLNDLAEQFRSFAEDRRRLARTCAWAATQWFADAASLWFFLAALGVDTAPDGLLIAFGLANVAASIPFTPGGLGVYEAVLTAGLVSFGVPSAEAIIGVLAYRLFEFWLPIPIGATAYLFAKASGPAQGSPPIETVQSAYLESATSADRPGDWARRRGLDVSRNNARRQPHEPQGDLDARP